MSIKSCLLISEIISEKFSKLWHLESKHMPEIVQKWGEFRKEWHIVFKSYDSKCSSSYSWVRNKEVELFMNLHSNDISAFHGCFSWNSSRPPFLRTNLDRSGKFMHIQIYKVSMTMSIQMSHWHQQMVNGAEHLISGHWLAFLSAISHLQLIQNSTPSTICWCQCDIQIRIQIEF